MTQIPQFTPTKTHPRKETASTHSMSGHLA